MKHQYKINMAAKQVGVSPQTVRYYEKEGLIEPHREEFGTTRYYNVRLLKQLANVRRYYKLGFTDKDVRFLVGCNDMAEMERFFTSKAEEAQRNMELMRRRIDAMRLQAADLAAAQKQIGVCKLVQSPALVLLITHMNEKIAEDPDTEKVLECWIDHFYDTRLASLIQKEDFLFHPAEVRRQSGYCCYAEGAAWIGERKSNRCLIHLPARLCVYTVCKITGEQLTPASIMPEALAFIQAHCLTVCGDVYGRCLAVLGEISNKTTGHPQETWYEYWIPVEKRA